MKTILLILLLCPCLCIAQDVEPVTSDVYQQLIKKDSLYPRYLDTTNNMYRAVLKYTAPFNFANEKVKQVNIQKDGSLVFQALHRKYLRVGAQFTTKTEIQQRNAMPALQQQYVQGHNINGTPQWQGPHTNELFSYGPAINSLEYDGTNYPYDTKGKLVAAGNGNGVQSNAYPFTLFRTAALFSNSGTLYMNYIKDGTAKLRSQFRGGTTHINSIMQANQNQTGYFNTQQEWLLKKYTVAGSWGYQSEHFSNSNRNGFLNRVYAAALLTPVSFDNKQGTLLGNTQRSYSANADNPYFLLENNNHTYKQQQYNGSCSIERKTNLKSLKLVAGYEIINQFSREDYQPGTAFIHSGAAVSRNASDHNYFAAFNGTRKIEFDSYQYRFRGLAAFNYSFSDFNTTIRYPFQQQLYQYHRTAHEAVVSYNQTYRRRNIETAVTVNNKVLVSGTAAQNHFFAPGINGYITHTNLIDGSNWSGKCYANYTVSYSELPLHQSMSGSTSTGIDAASYQQWIPTAEVTGFNNLLTIMHKDLSIGVQLSNTYHHTFSAYWFVQNNSDDIFPVVTNNQLQLMNLASHQKKGIELEYNNFIRTSHYNDGVSLSSTISFTAYKDIITDIKTGYNYTPVAGFSNVNKALVQGASSGAITGSRYVRDAQNNMVMDGNGWPLVAAQPGIIGDAVPDFVVRFSHHTQWKRWSFNADVEWKKGGDVWNGTAAMLDYYGRSANSGDLRNTTGYIFPGVDVNGKSNTTPVNFYDPALPLQQNRWVRYGTTGVAESYIQKGDYVKLHTVGISYSYNIKKNFDRPVRFSLYASNIMLWSAYKSGDASSVLFDQSNGTGLDFFNLPSVHSFGCSVSLKI